MLIMMIAAPIAIVLIGPMGIWVGTAISDVVYFVHSKLGFVAVAIMGAIWPLLVMTGMHRVFTPTIITTIAETGMEGMVMPSEIGANISLGGVSLAVAFKTKIRNCVRRLSQQHLLLSLLVLRSRLSTVWQYV